MNTAWPTMGFISSWQVYEGGAVEPYAHAMMQGMWAAAREQGYHLLLACGSGPVPDIHSPAPAWPFPASGLPQRALHGSVSCFTPVGPANCAGLVVLPTELTAEQTHDIELLRASGYPLVMCGPGEPGPAVVIDNAAGIRELVEHLVRHGHTRIGFVAGLDRPRGDSAERRAAFSAALRAFGLLEDPRLVAYGGHSVAGGQRAAQHILASGAPFTALVCSNDRSAMGAITALNAAGRRVPEDVAVTGFDDVPEAGAWSPPLTTVRNPSFEKGYQAAMRLAALIRERAKANHQPSAPAEQITTISAPLVVRRSCGCDPLHTITLAGRPQALADLDARLAGAAAREVRAMAREEAESLSRALAASFLASLEQRDPLPMRRAVQHIVERSTELDEDVFAWSVVASALRDSAQRSALLPVERMWALELAEEMNLQVIESWRRQFSQRQLHQSELSGRLNSLSSRLLLALDLPQIRAVLAEHLSGLGVQRLLLACRRPVEPGAEEDEEEARYEVLLALGFERELAGETLRAWQFPTPAWDAEAERLGRGERLSQAERLSQVDPLCLALLPFHVPDQLTGYVAFESSDLGPLAMITRSLESALRGSALYEEALHGRRMAEEASLLKSRFLSMVSHELRTPLNLISGLSGLLLRQKGQPAGPALWQDVERIYANAQHLARLIGDVLDLASSSSGQMRLLREPLDLAEVLRPVAAAGEQLARDKGLAWRAALPEHGPYVLGDRTRLRQVALNLISNAVKFTARGEVALLVTTEGREVCVAVRDTGLGVAPADQQLVWGDFSRSERVMRRGIGGIGLGLAITRELVERQGGRVGLQSSGVEGEGSTFSFSLPAIDPPPGLLDPHDVPEHENSALTGSIALLATAAEPVRALADGLRQRGFTVVVHTPPEDGQWLVRLLSAPESAPSLEMEAPSQAMGAPSQAMAAPTQPAAVLIEEQLAGQQGWEILSTLKHNPLTAHLPVLVVNAGALGGPHGAGQPGGAVLELDYQTKPLNLDQLTRLLRLTRLTGEQLTLLVVDDDPILRSLHTRLIAEQLPDGKILQAADGREALEIMRQVTPGLVLLDLMMPGVDGFGVLEGMHADERLRDVPVVVLTAKVLTESDLQRLNQGVTAVLTKGVFGPPEVIDRIAGVLGKQRALNATAQRLVRRAVGYIQAHFADPLTRDQIASYVNISADHLSDCFHQELGITPIAYLIRYRVYRACQLLEQGRLSITEVAQAVGFSESANFSRAFQREMGVSPRAYGKGKRT